MTFETPPCRSPRASCGACPAVRARGSARPRPRPFRRGLRALAQGVDASTGATFDPVVVHRPAFDPFHKSNITQVVGNLIPGVGGIIPNVSNILNPLGASLSG